MSVKSTQKSRFDWAKEALHTWLPAVILCLFFRGTVAEARYIPSSSMEPTLRIHDYILVDKISRVCGRPIKRGDMVVFYPPKIETDVPDPCMPFYNNLAPFVREKPGAFIKRVIGLPGDIIEVKRNEGVYINGLKLSEENAIPKPSYDMLRLGDIQGISANGNYIRPFGHNSSPVVVPSHHFFVLGDNRSNSADSHVWGFVQDSRIVGRVCLSVRPPKWMTPLLVWQSESK